MNRSLAVATVLAIVAVFGATGQAVAVPSSAGAVQPDSWAAGATQLATIEFTSADTATGLDSPGFRIDMGENWMSGVERSRDMTYASGAYTCTFDGGTATLQSSATGGFPLPTSTPACSHDRNGLSFFGGGSGSDYDLAFESGTKVTFTISAGVLTAPATPGADVFTLSYYDFDSEITLQSTNVAVTITDGSTPPATTAEMQPASYGLSFDATAGSCAASQPAVGSGTWVQLPTADKCSRPGYVLAGWLAKQTDGPPAILFAPGGWTVMSGDNTLYAVWQAAP